MNIFIRFHRFLDFSNIKILCILMFLIIAFIKSFRIEMLVVFLDIFGHEHKFET
jgi:hypothetical protein